MPHNLHYHFHLGESHSLYVTHTIKRFAESLIGIFVPIYIFTLEGKPQIHYNPIISDILWVMIFYMIRSLSVLVLINTILNFVFRHLNFKMSIFTSGVMTAIMIGFISLSQANYLFLLAAAILAAMDTILYWIPYHVLFVRKAASRDGNFGKNFGIRRLLSLTASALGPILGGVLIATIKFTGLFIVGIILIIISAIPILFSVHEHKHKQHNAIKIFNKYFNKRSNLQYNIAFSASALEGSLFGIFWPLLLLVVIESFTKVGLITSLSLTISAAASVQVGRFIDKHGTRKVHRIGVIINSLLYLPRTFIGAPRFIYAVDVLDKLNSSSNVIPFNAVMYKHAKESKHDLEFIIYRDMIIHLGLLAGLVLTTIVIMFSAEWRWVFIFIAAVAPLTYFINFQFADKKTAEETAKALT